MIERIERDRENIKKKKTEGQTDTSEFSYLPFFAPNKALTPRLNLSKLSTINLLVFLEESFKNGDKYIMRNLDKIKTGIIEREDLFISTLKYLENKKIRDEMFYWTPGYKISNIFSFIVELIPNFVEQYKEYYIKQIVCKKVHLNALNFIKERYTTEYERFKIIEKDLLLFNNCISSHVWLDENSKRQISKKSIDFLGIEEFYDVCEDLMAILAPSASFIEVTVYDKFFIASISEFDGLVNKDPRFKDWWIKNGLNEEEWDMF